MKNFCFPASTLGPMRYYLLCLLMVSTTGLAQYHSTSSRQAASRYSGNDSNGVDYTLIDPTTLTSYSSTGLPVSDDSTTSQSGHYRQRYAGRQRLRDSDQTSSVASSSYEPPDLTKEATLGKDLIDEPDYLTTMMIESASETGQDPSLTDRKKKRHASNLQMSKKQLLESSLSSESVTVDPSSFSSLSQRTSAPDNGSRSSDNKRSRLSPALKSYKNMMSGGDVN